MQCPKCHTEITGKERFCKSCGTGLAPSQSSAAVCPACGANVPSGAKFCASCAAPLGAAPRSAAPVCGNCGAGLQSGAKFCKACGKPTASVAAAAAPAPVQVEEPTPPAPKPTPPVVPTAPVPAAPVAAQDAARLAASEAPTLIEPSPVQRSSAPAPAATPPRPAKPVEKLKPAQVAASPVRPTASAGGNRTLLVSVVALVVIAALGATYWFVLRKPPAAPVAQAPAPESPAQQPTTEAAPPSGTTAESPDASSVPPASTDAVPAEATPPNTPGTPSTQQPAARPAKPAAAKPGRPAYAQAHDNAVQALQASKFLEPADGSALFWARKAKALGDPGAAQIEQQVFAKQMSDIAASRQNRNYDQARAQIYQLATAFPDHAELRQLQDEVQKEQQTYAQQQEEQRRQAELATRIKKIAVQHRHGIGNRSCSGIITVNPDGTAKYDCTTADEAGRCDHASFGAGSLKEVKLRGDGSLHVATKQSGNFDFVGGDMSLRDAMESLKPLISR